ncbi:MAG: polyketide synthase, partial [Acidobacteria bacterium]|nr:polyketide synthase [Acidobacteriota bacterium]
MTGASQSAIGGRISYTFGMTGPAMVVDTACSSSLVAASLAADGLAKGDCDIALVCGAQASLTAGPFVALCQMRALSADGLCKTFDASADGYGRGEGVGVVVAMRLAEAAEQGRRVMAVVLGSAVNHDGRSSGFTAPNGPAQEAVYRAALRRARVEAREVGVIEAHGTGTALGDPIEVGSLAAVYGPGSGRIGREPFVLGSAKTNIGHLEGAAGIAGLLKVVLELEQGEVAPHLHLRRLNPHLPALREGVRAVIPRVALARAVIPRVALAWPAATGRRRRRTGAAAATETTTAGQRRVACVSSFGMSGTNAHAVVGEAPDSPAAAAAAAAAAASSSSASSSSSPSQAAPEGKERRGGGGGGLGGRRALLLCLSAKSEGALRELARRYAARVERAATADEVAAVCAAAALCRTHMQQHRAAVVVASSGSAPVSGAAASSPPPPPPPSSSPSSA